MDQFKSTPVPASVQQVPVPHNSNYVSVSSSGVIPTARRISILKMNTNRQDSSTTPPLEKIRPNFSLPPSFFATGPSMSSSSVAVTGGRTESVFTKSNPTCFPFLREKKETTMAMAATNKPSRLPPTAAAPSKRRVNVNISKGPDAVFAGSNMRKMLDDLHNTRMRIDQNQRDYEKTRRKIEVLNREIVKVKLESRIAGEKLTELMKAAASKKSELSCLEIRNKIISESIDKGEMERIDAVNELYQVRMDVACVTSRNLSDAVAFAKMYSSNEDTNQDRRKQKKRELEHLESYKGELELELSEFLLLQTGAQQCLKELEILNQEFDKHDQQVTKEEQEHQRLIDTIDSTLYDLELEEQDFIKDSEKECDKLKREIEEINKRIASLETEGKQTKVTIKTQTKTMKQPRSPELNRTLNYGQEASNSRDILNARVDTQNVRSKATGKSNFQPPPPFLADKHSDKNEKMSESKCTDPFTIEDDEFGDDEECLAAAEAVSQSIRAYEPMIPCPSYVPPVKVRLVDPPLASVTPFMKQLSSTKVIKRRPKTQASQASQRKTQQKKPVATQQQKPVVSHQTQPKKPVTTQQQKPVAPRQTQIPRIPSFTQLSTVPAARKSFQFKKRTSTTASVSNSPFSFLDREKENFTNPPSPQNNTDDFPDSNFFGASFNDNSNDPRDVNNDEDYIHAEFENHAIQQRPSPSVYDMPYSTFNSSRILLSSSQEEDML